MCLFCALMFFLVLCYLQRFVFRGWYLGYVWSGSRCADYSLVIVHQIIVMIRGIIYQISFEDTLAYIEVKVKI
jgi:hypothetical protein